MDEGEALRELQHWYEAQCDGDWEHQHGVRIETIDNPGWHVRIDLHRTALEGKPFEPVSVKSDEEYAPWMECRVADGRFEGVGSPDSLGNILGAFVEWAKSEPRWLESPADLEFQEEQTRAAWALLGADAGPGPCAEAGCGRYRVKHGVLCREHHWAMLHGGRPYPFLQEEKEA